MLQHTEVSHVVKSQAFNLSISLVICVALLLLVLNTMGWQTYWWDKAILVVFTLEAALKIYVDRWQYFRSGWNRFDFAIVVLGWSLVLAAIFAAPPEWAAALARVLRIVRLGEKIEPINRVLQTLYASFAGLTGALLLAALAMLIFVLSGTLMFAPLEPFVSLGITFWHLTLLSEVTVAFFEADMSNVVLGLYLQAYQVVMSLTVINLVVTALIDGMQKSQEKSRQYATKGDIERIEQKLDELLRSQRKD